MSRPLATALDKLLGQVGDAPSSLFTAEQRKSLEIFSRQTGCVRMRPQGRGVVFTVTDRAALETHLRSHRPESAESLPENLPQRATNVATHRDSKARGGAHAVHYLLLKAAGETVHWTHSDGRVLDLSSVTAAAGAGVLAIQNGDGWTSNQPLWLVENQALFDRTDWLPNDTRASIAYYAGQLPARVLSWLSNVARAPEVVLFPDYDGVGLQNYVRLRDHCKSPCLFWLMPGWRELLVKYGSNRVWQDTHAEFLAATQRLLRLAAPPELIELCELMSREGRALEHEAVWL